MPQIGFVDIELHRPDEGFSQAKYLAHSHSDVLWTDDLDAAVEFAKNGLLAT